jgi:hypothetical protein
MEVSGGVHLSQHFAKTKEYQNNLYLIFQLQASVLGIKGKESGLLPTPHNRWIIVARKGNETKSRAEHNNTGNLESKFRYGIPRTNMYPTPTQDSSIRAEPRNTNKGRYLFTLDWSEGDFNELDFGYASKPDQHKCGHVIQLDNGNFAIQPNNRMRVFDSVIWV